MNSSAGMVGLVVAWAVLACLAVAVAGHSILKRCRLRRSLRAARELLKAGRPRDALNVYLEADSAWMQRSTECSRKASLEDLDELETIWREIDTIRAAEDLVVGLEGLFETIRQLRALFDDRSNFRIDNVSMKAPAAREHVHLMDLLKANRDLLRLRIAEVVSEWSA